MILILSVINLCDRSRRELKSVLYQASEIWKTERGRVFAGQGWSRCSWSGICRWTSACPQLQENRRLRTHCSWCHDGEACEASCGAVWRQILSGLRKTLGKSPHSSGGFGRSNSDAL